MTITGGSAASSNHHARQILREKEARRRRNEAEKKKMMYEKKGYAASTMTGTTAPSTTAPHYLGVDTTSQSSGVMNKRHHQMDDDMNGSGRSEGSRRQWEMGDPRRIDDSIISKYRDKIGWFINWSPIQTFMTVLIILNAILLGVLTFDDVKNNEPLSYALEQLDLVILSLFTIEFLFQFIYLGFSLVQNGWLMFDCIVLSFSWIFINSSIAVLRSFRIFRVFSLVSKWESLRMLFAAVGKTMPKMASIWTALMIFFYIFCVLCTTLYADLYEEGHLDWDYFGRLDYTFITLFQIMTLDSWTAVVRQVMDGQPWAWLLFFTWVVITSFFVLNLVVAVICESLIEIQKAKDMEKEGAAMEENNNKQAASAMQMEELIRQQHHMLGVQQDLIRTQVEMQQTLNMIMLSMNNSAPPSTSSHHHHPTSSSSSHNTMLLEQMISEEEAQSFNNSTDSSLLQRFHSSSDSILSNVSRSRLEQ